MQAHGRSLHSVFNDSQSSKINATANCSTQKRWTNADEDVEHHNANVTAQDANGWWVLCVSPDGVAVDAAPCATGPLRASQPWLGTKAFPASSGSVPTCRPRAAVCVPSAPFASIGHKSPRRLNNCRGEGCSFHGLGLGPCGAFGGALVL